MSDLEQINERIDMALANYRAMWKSGNEHEANFWNKYLGNLYDIREEIKRGKGARA